VELMSDNRNMRGAHRTSIFFHEKRMYDCPQCKKPMDRINRHGWYWYCATCKKDFPLYLLKEPETMVMEPAKPKGWMAKVKEVLRG
jgi:ribosomal protein L37AE/L43A